MNIFLLDENPKKCAEYHVNTHVNKMCVEYSQLLCGVHHMVGNEITIPYKLTHKNHPCAVWLRESLSNYVFLCDIALEVCKEFSYRYEKRHKSQDVIEWAIINTPKIKDVGLTELPKAMPDEYKVDCVVQSYRNYYNYGKTNLLIWKKREKPYWVIN
jgi:hypothetical protein